MTNKHLNSFENLGRSLNRLKEILAVQIDEGEFILDGVIQRFEFVVELYWKTLKHLLLLRGVETKLPKESLQKAYEAGWLDDEKLWLQMMRDRNLTSHTYQHALALEIYERIKIYYPCLAKTFEKLKLEFKNELNFKN